MRSSSWSRCPSCGTRLRRNRTRGPRPLIAFLGEETGMQLGDLVVLCLCGLLIFVAVFWVVGVL